MLANELIDRLERRGLLDQEIIEALREQLTEGGARVTPEAVAKLLVDNGQLTRFQASKLIGELRSPDYEDVVEAVDDDLASFGDDVLMVDEVFDAEPFDAEPVVAVAVDAEPVDAVAMENGDGRERPRPKRPSGRVAPPEHKSVWDSFKIYGYLGIIGFLAIAGYGFYFILSKASADEVIDAANKQYNSQSYQPAQDAYISFLAQFGEDNQYSSLARTRIGMSEIYRSSQMTDPTEGLRKAKEVLPRIIDEPGMNDERGNLGALLVDIAESIAKEASKATETTEKQRLLDELDEQWTLIDNPNYMLTSMKTTLEGRLLQVTEARNRVQRDIVRNIRLDETEAAMKQSLASKDTKKAYDLRKSLLRDFPELSVDPRLTVLVSEASSIQETLVAPSKDQPEPITAPVEEGSLKSIVLTNRVEVRPPLPGLQDQIFYLRAGGSVLAFSVYDGQLLWRKFTGYGEDHTPIRLDDGRSVLLTDLNQNEVQSYRGQDGQLQWRLKIGEPFVDPVAGKDSILISVESGRLVSLDSETGDTNWVTQLPQTISAPAGIDDKLNRVYLPGDHSNLYVLDSKTGKSVESFYTAHEAGTIAVAPVSLLGHLFVIENAGADYANLHVLRMDSEGGGLKVAQQPFRLTGNVLVPPVIQQRRMIVLTDRGQVAVFDIEPTAEGEQVSKIAEQVASYEKPTLTHMAVGRSQMWITGTRIGRYELQINTGRVVFDWGKEEGDTFIGQPLALEDMLIHARVLRGTSAIRVTGAVPKTGEQIWRTDVGTPISMLVKADKGFHAITSQGALFELDLESLKSGSTQGPIENPGANSISMNFTDPIAIDENRYVLLNRSQPNESMVYDPTRRREILRKVTYHLSDPKPVGVGIFSGGGMLLPLDKGRVVLMNWETGAPKGAPFQPASNPSPDNTVSWSTPVRLSTDADQVLLTDSRKKLYRVRVGEQIRELSSIDLKSPFLDKTIGIGNAFVGGVSGPAADYLVGYEEEGLTEKFEKLLDGRIQWGPSLATTDDGKELALLITNDSVLRAFSADGEQVFQTPMPVPGLPVRDVVSIRGRWILTGVDGWLVAIEPATGKVLGTIELGQPLSASPLPAGNQLFVPGAEGVVYITNIPGEN